MNSFEKELLAKLDVLNQNLREQTQACKELYAQYIKAVEEQDVTIFTHTVPRKKAREMWAAAKSDEA
jgi:hypothetical protein